MHKTPDLDLNPTYVASLMMLSTDIDECLSDHDCNHTCSNVDGSYTCSCREGYVLQADERNCTGEISI